MTASSVSVTTYLCHKDKPVQVAPCSLLPVSSVFTTQIQIHSIIETHLLTQSALICVVDEVD